MRPGVLIALLLAGALGSNLAFLGLGLVFDYPDVLGHPPAEVLDLFHRNQFAVSALFVLLAVCAGLLAPISIGLAARASDSRWIVPVGAAGAAVQVIGLARWPLIVPFVEDPDTFRALSTVLGTIVGETLGYAATAAWTVLVARQFGVRFLAWPAAVLISAGVLVPLGVPGADLANFVGYLLWTVWLLVLAAQVRQRTRNNAVTTPQRAERSMAA